MIVNADMITYNQNKESNCVIMPLTVFNYIIDEEKQNECLSNIHKYLSKEGILIIELLTKETFKEIENDKYGAEFKYIKKFETDDGYYEYWRKTNRNCKLDFYNKDSEDLFIKARKQ